MKLYKRCKISKSFEEFHKHKQCRDGFRPECKVCYNERNKNLYRKNKDRVYNTFYKTKYGISLEIYNKMLEMQSKRCAICKTEQTNNKFHKKLSVDHRHKTGKVRGLLCSNCNTAIGLLKEDINVLKNAINYLTTI